MDICRRSRGPAESVRVDFGLALGFASGSLTSPTGDDFSLRDISSGRWMYQSGGSKHVRRNAGGNTHTIRAMAGSQRYGDERGGARQSPFRGFVCAMHGVCAAREYTPKDAPTVRWATPLFGMNRWLHATLHMAISITSLRFI